jgi:hypothetical protein
MPRNPTEIRASAIANFEAAQRALADELCSDGDCFVDAFAATVESSWEYESTRRRTILAARAGYLAEIVRRNAMRSDNAL